MARLQHLADGVARELADLLARPRRTLMSCVPRNPYLQERLYLIRQLGDLCGPLRLREFPKRDQEWNAPRHGSS